MWLGRRAIELVFAARDLKAFARDCNYDGPPFRWDEERRFLIRCELDAAYFHLYLGSDEEWGADNPTLREMFPTPRDAVDYIMDTFPIVRRKDEAKYDGDYRTKRTILEIYDAMAEAIRTGQPYQTQLNPPPGPPTDAEGNFIPSAQWTDAIREQYEAVIHIPVEEAPTRRQPAEPLPAKRKELAPAAAVMGGRFPDGELQTLLVGLTADLVRKFPGSTVQTCREMQGVAISPGLIAKLIASESQQAELDAAIAQVSIEFDQLSSLGAPWSKVLRTLKEADAIEVTEIGNSTVLSPGQNCEDVISHFGTLPEPYMQFVELAIRAYQESATEELEQATELEIQNAQVNWLKTTDG